MSAKWRRSLAWDDRFFPSWAWPAKAVLRAFSSIPLAVSLLILVATYGILASVPVGVIVLGLTQLFYGVTLIAVITVVATGLIVPARFLISDPGRRFLVYVFAVLIAVGAGSLLWMRYLWPVLHYDPVTHSGVRFFAPFIEANKAITLRRLPGMEMSELEFYGWWPLRVILVAFVLNMVVATLRRIEFNYKNIGVLTVHTGIVLIGLGSIYYNGLKREGDTLLLAGQMQPAEPGKVRAEVPGPPVNSFYDATRVALYVQQIKQWGGNGLEQRPLTGVPRYNDYNLSAFGGESILESSGRKRPWESMPSLPALDIAVPDSPLDLVDPDIKFRIVGYASYAETTEDWRKVDPELISSLREGFRFNPLRSVFLLSELPDETGKKNDKPVFSFNFLPNLPARRVAVNDVLGIEFTLGPDAGMSDQRWQDLTAQLPVDTEHALIVEVPSKKPDEPPVRKVVPVEVGTQFTVDGYKLTVEQLTPEPPFPIVTESHKGATSSVAVVRVQPPTGDGYTRYVYHRFSELNQDILDTPKPDGRMNRRDADPAIRIAYIDAAIAQVYFDERANGNEKGKTRAIIRQRGGVLRVVDDLPSSGLLSEFFPKLSLRIDQRWAHAERADRPVPVADDERDKRQIGTHDKALLAVEVTLAGNDLSGKATGNRAKPWSTIVWLPFQKYLGMQKDANRQVILPDGRLIELAFGRLRHVFRDFAISLVDFKMIAYDHRGAPRDFESVVRVQPAGSESPAFVPYQHACSLNEPLTAPFLWTDSRPWVANAALRLVSGLNPNQFKMSQAAWDQEGWRESQKLADAGMLAAPRARFTILQVGNNPGIHIIALGGILMALGIPWAFYLKPYLVRREKRQIQELVAKGEYFPPGRKPGPTVVVVRKQPAPETVSTP
ncbi:MAG: hypothetical protein KF805_12855 [Phycisphaeraceae bacterium]|nr:hypothetical protein [Phycisphaeraceae bacterium]